MPGLVACAGDAPRQDPRAPESIQADIQAPIPVRMAQRAACAVDPQRVFVGLKLQASTENLCAVLAEARSGKAQARAVLPRIVLNSPKITRRPGSARRNGALFRRFPGLCAAER